MDFLVSRFLTSPRNTMKGDQRWNRPAVTMEEHEGTGFGAAALLREQE